MTVFKVYFLIIRRNFAAILMYIGIFAGIAVAIQASFRHTGMTEGFSAMKLDVAVVDRGGGILSETLQEVLGLQHDLVTIADDEQVIQEELYYGNVKYVLIVQHWKNCRQANRQYRVLQYREPLQLIMWKLR